MIHTRATRPKNRPPGYLVALALVALALAALPLVVAAQAQRATDAESAAPQLDEIVVTAQKRAQSIDSVGMSITALSGDQLKALGVNSVAELTKADPSFVFSQALRGQPVYAIRGVGYNDFSLAASPTVSVYTDEVPYAYPVMTKGAPFDLERVEVLKGPQGTLFGQNATGGAVNYIAAKPTDGFRAEVGATYASFDAVNLNAFVSGPLSDALKARLAFNGNTGGAWQKSDTRDDRLGSQDNAQLRLLVDWRPADRLTVSFNLNGWVDKSDTLAGQKIGLYLQTPKYAPLIPQVVNEPLAPQNDHEADWLAGLHPRNDETYYQGSVRADYATAAGVHLTYLGTYESYEQHDIADNTGSNTDFWLRMNGNVDSTAHELRFSGGGPQDRLNWLLGLNYSRTSAREDQDETLLDSTSAYALTTAPVAIGLPPIPPFAGINNVSKDIATGRAVFANLEYRPLAALNLRAGARYTQTDIDHGGCTEDKDGNAAAGFTAVETRVKHGVGVVPIAKGGCVTFGPTLIPGYQQFELDQHNVSWNVGANWTPLDKTLVYLTVSKGYKAGSFPTLAATTYLQLKPVTQESVLSYELGLKTRLDDNRLELDGAVFHYDYDNKQLEAREPDPQGIFGFLNVLVNVPKSREDGAELSTRFRLADHWTLTAQATYLDTKIVGSFINYNPYANTTIDLGGEPFPNTPKWAMNAGARYQWTIGHYSAFVGANARYEGESQGAFGTQDAINHGLPSYAIDSYTVLDVRAGIAADDERWNVEFFGNNVTDRYYWTQVERPAENVVRMTGMPAVFGIRARYSW